MQFGKGSPVGGRGYRPDAINRIMAYGRVPGLDKAVKLLVITGDFPPNRTGDANHVFFLARNLAAQGVEVQVLTWALEGIPECPGVAVCPEMKGWSWRDLPHLVRFLRRSHPDWILQIYDQFGRMYGHQPMMTFAPTIARRVLPSVRFVTQVETPYGIRTRRLGFWTRVIRRGMKRWSLLGPGYHPYGTLLRDSDHVIVLSEAHRTKLLEECPQLLEKSSLIPPPPIMAFCEQGSRAQARTALGTREDEFLFAFFGYVYKGKGMETLFEAFRRVADCLPQAKLVLIGGYSNDRFNPEGTAKNRLYWESMHALVRHLGISERVIWTGSHSPQDEQASLFLTGSDACVLPFDYGIHLNNSSVAVAAHHGLPLIATRVSDTESQFLDGEAVQLCPPCDPAALAGALQAVATDAALRERLRAGIRELAKEWFSWDRAVERTLRAFC